MRKKGKRAAGLLFIFSIVLFSISLYFLMGMFMENRKAEELYQELASIYGGGDGTEPGTVPEDGGLGNGNGETEPEAVISPGLLALHAENADCIGWLSIEGTAVDYPVMYHPQEADYYLHRDFYGNYSAGGSLYLSELCDPEASASLLIYGHHMKSGAMFAALDNYKDEGFYEEHPAIVFDTLHGTEQYRIIAVFRTPVYTGTDFAYYTFTGGETEEEFDTYIQEIMSRSLYDTGLTASYGDHLLSLSTCEYSQANGRHVVVAKRID